MNKSLIKNMYIEIILIFISLIYSYRLYDLNNKLAIYNWRVDYIKILTFHGSKALWFFVIYVLLSFLIILRISNNINKIRWENLSFNEIMVRLIFLIFLILIIILLFILIQNPILRVITIGIGIGLALVEK